MSKWFVLSALLGALALRAQVVVPAPQLPDDSGGPDHQHTAQDLVPGARDNPMPYFASSGVNRTGFVGGSLS